MKNKEISDFFHSFFYLCLVNLFCYLGIIMMMMTSRHFITGLTWSTLMFIHLFIDCLLCACFDRCKVPHQMDRTGSNQLWHLLHKIRCVVIWGSSDRNSNIRTHTLPG